LIKGLALLDKTWVKLFYVIQPLFNC